MRKSDIAQRLKERTGLSAKESMEAVNAIFEAIITGLTKGKRITIKGFGTFEVRKYNARNFRNPKTGELIPKGEYHRPWFRSSKLLKARLNGKD